MKRKLLIAMLALIGITGVATTLALRSKQSASTVPQVQINPAGEAPAFNEPPMSPAVSPASFAAINASSAATASTSASGTGAILVAPPATDIEASKELFALLNQGTIQEATFTIQPMPQERKIVITVKGPIEDNFGNVQNWLDANGYSNIPKKNIQYVESQ